MKKLLLVTTAIAGVAFMSAPASAAVKLDLGGFFRGYGVFANNDVVASGEHSFEFRRDTELQATGETTLDNGLTVGFHSELKVATQQALSATSSATAVDTDEVYAYASGGWGRVNFGVEDGAAYLLQVAAPSADSNIDGLRTNISAINTSGLTGLVDMGYAQADFGGPGNGTDRLTYLTPKFNGFQAGFSYAPHNGVVTNLAQFGVDTIDQFDNLWEAGVRYDGEFEGFGISAGAGYSDSSVELNTGGTFTDGIKSWNGGLNVSAQGFSLGGAYKESKTEQTVDWTSKTWTVGGAYDNGPWHAGASYLDSKLEIDGVANDEEIEKYTVGGGYGFGPGMTFRGAVAWGNVQASGATTDDDFTQVTVGTDIQF